MLVWFDFTRRQCEVYRAPQTYEDVRTALGNGKATGRNIQLSVRIMRHCRLSGHMIRP